MAKQKAAGEKKAKVVKPVKAKTDARATRRANVKDALIRAITVMDPKAEVGEYTPEELEEIDPAVDAIIDLWDALNGK